MGQVAGVLDDPPGFPCTLPGVDVLEGGKLTSNNVAGSSHDPLQSFAVASGAVSKFGDDVGAVCGCTVMCVQGVQEWAEDAALRSTSVEDQGR